MTPRAAACAVALALVACSREDDRRPRPLGAGAARAGLPSQAATVAPPPRILFLPDAGAPPPGAAVLPPVPLGRASRCPPEMVLVQGVFCIDRYESTLMDARTGQRLSPNYPPSASATRREYEKWQKARADAPTSLGRSVAVPPPGEWALAAREFEPVATSVAGSVPNGYTSGEAAQAACTRARKRLCSVEEWVTACRGVQNRQFPYGHLFEEGRCNVYRATHPARVLHGDASVGHLDPRLNTLDEGGDPLLRKTGGTPACRSEWDGDAVFDMVGNLDEWVEDPNGTFVGGFYARSTRSGCDARVEVHSFDYFDYSLGTRCCTTP